MQVFIALSIMILYLLAGAWMTACHYRGRSLPLVNPSPVSYENFFVALGVLLFWPLILVLMIGRKK